MQFFKKTLILLFVFTSVSMLAGNNKREVYYNDGLSFTENKGQVIDQNGNPRNDILFTGDASGINFYIRNTGVSYVLQKTEGLDAISAHDIKPEDPRNVSTHRVDMDFAGANANAVVVKNNEAYGYKNFYLHHCPDGIMNVKSYNTVIQKNIYNQVDVIYRGSGSEGMKYDIVVNPGGKPSDIQIKYTGADEVSLSEEGVLIIKTSLGDINEKMPRVYQSVAGKIIDIKARYVLKEGVITFEVGAYNKQMPLIIDPWITYIGGTSMEFAYGISTDAAGNVLVGGNTSSANFPVLGAFQSVFSMANDVFVSKLSASGSLVWSTYYGGTSSDNCSGVWFDAVGDAYVTGQTGSANFPIGAAGGQISFLNTYPGTSCAFVVKLNSAGARLWATFYGDSQTAKSTRGIDITTDVTGNVILYGETNAPNNIATTGVFQVNFGGGTWVNDVFVVKFSSIGARIWGSYCGGTKNERASGVACDASSNIYITGTTAGPTGNDFPVSAGSHQVVYGGGNDDAFLFKFSSTGQRLWATYYGGSLIESAYGGPAVAVDAAGDVYLGGGTTSSNGIATTGSYQPAKSSAVADNKDAFLVKFNSAGVRQWATYMGGTTGPQAYSGGMDYITGVSIDNNFVVVGGDTYSSNFPVTSCAYQSQFLGTEDQFIASFTTSGSLICSGFLGTGNSTSPNNETDTPSGSIATHGGSVYMVAFTSCNYPTTANAYQPVCAGAWDAAVSKLCINSCGLPNIIANISANKTLLCNTADSVNYTLQNTSCSQAGTTYQWFFGGATPATSTLQNPSGIVYNTPGVFPVKVIITTPCGVDSIVNAAYISVAAGAITSVSNDTSICIGNSASFTASGGASYLWNTGATTQSILVSPTTTSTYTVTITDANNCTSVYTRTVGIDTTSPTAVVAGVSPICYGQLATLTASGGNTYLWSTGSTTAIVSVSPTTNSVYTVTVFGACGNDTATLPVSINPLPIVSFSADDTAGCSPLCVNFSNTSANTVSQTWSFDNTTSSQPSPYHCFTQSGSYSVKLIVTDNNGCTDSLLKVNYIIVHPDPVADFDVSSNPSKTDMPVYFTDKSTGAISWYWAFGDLNNSSSSAQHPSFTYSDSGMYNVMLVVVNQFGCVDTTYKSLLIQPEFTFYIPNTFTPNGDGVNELFFPKASSINFSDFDFYIFDRWGNQIFHTTDFNKGWDGKLNGRTVQQDTYVWRVKTADLYGNKLEYTGHVNVVR